MDVHFVEIDTREVQDVRDVFTAALTELGVEVREKAIQPSGDIKIVYGRNSAVVFERKERLDGIHSWMGGHLDDQIGRMLETGDDIELIVEGDLHEKVYAKGRNVLKMGPAFASQLKYYNRLLPVRRTKDLAHTVDWICDTIKAIRNNDYRSVQRKYRLEQPTHLEEMVALTCKKANVKRIRKGDLAALFDSFGHLVDKIRIERYVRMYEPLRWAIYWNPWHNGLMSLEQGLKFEAVLFGDNIPPITVRGLGPRVVQLIRSHWPTYIDFSSYVKQQPNQFIGLSVGGLSAPAKERIVAILCNTIGHELAGFGPHVSDTGKDAHANATYGNR